MSFKQNPTKALTDTLSIYFDQLQNTIEIVVSEHDFPWARRGHHAPPKGSLGVV